MFYPTDSGKSAPEEILFEISSRARFASHAFPIDVLCSYGSYDIGYEPFGALSLYTRLIPSEHARVHFKIAHTKTCHACSNAFC